MLSKRKLEVKLNSVKVPKSDEFLPTITSIFAATKWLGIPVYGGKMFLTLAIIILLMSICIEVTAIWKLIRGIAGLPRNVGDGRGITARLSGAIFYANTLISLSLIWRLLRSWQSLSLHWLTIETKGLYLKPANNIKKRVWSVTCFVMFCGCVEHGFSIVSTTGIDCPLTEYFRQYILSSHGFMLLENEYNLWVAIPIFITSLIATVLWNFQDLVVILISMGLASRYHRLNSYVNRFVVLERNQSGKSVFTTQTRAYTWRKIREAYVQQAGLVRKIDKELGALTILCNLNNFYFICLQLFIVLRQEDTIFFNSTYYKFSLGWLAFRASSVVLAAADVNLHSKRALPSLYRCPSSRCNIEVKRLKYHLTNDYVCITGLGILFMNRQMLLEVAAAIVRYVLILISFDT